MVILNSIHAQLTHIIGRHSAPHTQAEAMADATREVVVTDVATKGGVAFVKNDLATLEQRLIAALDTMGLRLTIRMGGLVAVGMAALAAIIKLERTDAY